MLGKIRYMLRGRLIAAFVMMLLSSGALLSALAGCGYRFTATGNSRIAPGQSLWASFIANDTVSATAQTVLRRALLDEFLSMRGCFPSGSPNDAALQVSGTLRSYSNSAISYTAIDRAREYRLAITVELEVRRRGESAPFWKGILQADQDYPANTDLALQHNAEEAALEAASRRLARKLITTLEQNY